MGMVFVVVLEPSGDLPECGDRLRKRVHANIVSLEGFDEALGDAIRFRALNGSKAGDEIESGGEGPGLVCRVDAAIVGKPPPRFTLLTSSSIEILSLTRATPVALSNQLTPSSPHK